MTESTKDWFNKLVESGAAADLCVNADATKLCTHNVELPHWGSSYRQNIVHNLYFGTKLEDGGFGEEESVEEESESDDSD